MSRILFTFAVLIFVITAASATAAQERGFADPLLGRWDLTVQSPEGDYPSWMEIRLRTERSLMAEFVGRFGSKRHAAEVSYSDGDFSLRVPTQYEQGDELVFSGRLRNGRLTGTMRTDDGPSFEWSGVPAPALARMTVPGWGSPVALIGEDLGGWTPRVARHADCWQVDDGILSAIPPCVDLVSDESFDDFRVSLEFRYPPGSNSGVYLRGRYEIQIQDDKGMPPDPLRIGGVYGFIAPTENAARGAGQWQTLEAELVGRRITVVLNGVEIISAREVPGITGGALDSDEGRPGPLMLQGDHGPIEYRNILVTPAR